MLPRCRGGFRVVAPRAHARSRGRLYGLVLVLLVALPATSYTRALTYPGQASFEVRTVDWVRDHGGGRLVDVAENWWYARPPSTREPSGPLMPLSAGLTTDTGGVPTPAALAPIGSHALPGEGFWRPGPLSVHSTPAMFQTFVRPDPAHPSVVAAVARFDPRLVSAQLIAGTKEPEARTTPGAGEVPPARHGDLVATFNSGFKMADALGGYYAGGRVVHPLRAGAASLVISRGGRLTVGEWGRDVRPGPDVAEVRQNLALIVDAGRPVPGLATNPGLRWGDSGNQGQYTWRSGLGVDAVGNLYYVAGDQLTLSTLARALAATGAVRAMELDIHPEMVNMFVYGHPVHGAPATTRLMSAMHEPLNRYLTPDQRDFIALYQRAAPRPAGPARDR
jgi:hypothetical protein